MLKENLNQIMMELKNKMDKEGIKVFYSTSECNSELYVDIKFICKKISCYLRNFSNPSKARVIDVC